MFYYKLYDRIFKSDIQLFNIPQITVSDPIADVIIHAGQFDYEEITQNRYNFILRKDFTIVRIKYGALRINTGNEILYSIKEGYNPECITPYIMGWGIAFVLTQMGYSAFHCSALTYNDQCFFVSGVSGAGKSTTALELIKHGCKYLCDDIAIVDSYENMNIPPAFPIQKVCPDVSLNLDDNLLYSINNDRGKYSYLNISDYCDTPKRLSVIFSLMTGDVPCVEVKEITGIDKFLRIIECLFLELQYALSHLPDEEKFRCLKIAGNVRLYMITRPKDKNTLDEITNTILSIMDKQGE
ncbi:MAG: hypothetical protein IKU06_11920 [Lachnospiraceae bacterium]|nr:hypothetical protein [Lachnospiraceae bacterium]